MSPADTTPPHHAPFPLPGGQAAAAHPLPQGERESDLEILKLLDFEPAPRKYKRANSWTPALQRQFIVQLALTGSPARAADAMQKCRYGAEKLYKADGAEGFRGAWDAAIALFEKRDAISRAGEREKWAGVRPPAGIDKRLNRHEPAPRGKADDRFDDEEDDMDEVAKAERIGDIGIKFLKKVAAEREARLAGKIVAADFYLRQVTVLEVMFDLMVKNVGENPWDMLRELQLGGHALLHIADTPFARMLDAQRREFWEAEGEPMRPEAFREEYMRDHGDHRTQAEQQVYGAATDPARGYTAEQWATMGFEEQREARHRQFDEDAAAQVEWEREAYEEFRARARALRAADEALGLGDRG